LSQFFAARPAKINCQKKALFELVRAVSVDKITIYVDFDSKLNIFKWGTMETYLTGFRSMCLKMVVLNSTPISRNAEARECGSEK
jgi:hypothetical protein